MSDRVQQSPASDGIREVSKNLPAVGLVATESNAEWIAAEILRIHSRAHQAIVTATVDADPQALAFARWLDAEVVEPTENRTEADTPRERLRRYAKQAGYPGLVYHGGGDGSVNLPASREALKGTEKFTIDARIEPVTDPEPTVMVGIPAYNEAGAIGSVVESAMEYADSVLVVDDGSTDNTVEIADAAGATVYEHERNVGYGGALKSIFEQADRSDTDYLVVLDADGQHDPSDIPELIERQRESDADIVIGNRFDDDAETEMPLYRRFGLFTVNLMTNLSLGILTPTKQISDTQSGFRAYSRAAIDSLASDSSIGDRMDASTNILYHAHSNGYQIAEVPTTIDYDVEASNNLGPVEHGLTLVGNIIRTVEREHPILLLGVPGVCFVLAGFLFTYLTMFNYLQSGTFPLGHALASTTFTITGILASFTGIILHSLELYRQ
ncbi:Glycosyltransferase involved in cell wall bisynthesis [Haloarcula vallismortis]|uniref:Dolichyl-phosphate beta-D-mannosyltransferase n=2 Tax=Haloarcula vallismortis TaxID=28442 RepID=M0JKG4_HALVA|nr:glycosyltransferase family 2 protein [Haloarcula vallismortis]EMA08838.1 dolichyl-phosphate beta-D-mannosyltransferase [Haloarcula vallismortis ATCC 29715]SDX23221.1 Glycosyltransferase involved in cell wall bisynthesis [Haloarcula vallismortis]